MLLRLGLLISLYSVLRVLFFVYNFAALQQFSLAALASAFLAGFGADLVAITLTNSVLFGILLLRPLVISLQSERLLNIIFLICNLPFLVINVIDLEYFKFTGERSSAKLWDVRADVPHQLGNFVIYFWPIALLAALVVLAACFFLSNERRPYRGSWQLGVIGLLAAASMPLHMSSQTDTLAANDSGEFRELARNSTLTLLRSQRECAAPSVIHSGEVPQNATTTGPLRLPASPPPRQDNVVILIVESLSTEYTGISGAAQDYTPFLTNLAKDGVSFVNHFANGRRSVDALPAILLGLPHLSPATLSCARARPLIGLGQILQSHGYRSLFFHGGRNGAGDFDVLARQTGFTDYYGADQYGRRKDFDGVWGIYDEPFLQFAANKLGARGQPFAAVIFTLSTHQPYKLPPQHSGRYAKGDLPIHEALGYTDHAFKRFFAVARKLPWFDRTLFVITGDHTGPAATPRQRLSDGFRVPLILFHPGQKLPAVDSSRPVQHADIAPTVLDYLKIRKPPIGIGRSVFDPTHEGAAFGRVGPRYWIAAGKRYQEFPAQEKPPLRDGLRGLWSRAQQKPSGDDLAVYLEANIQHFNTLLTPEAELPLNTRAALLIRFWVTHWIALRRPGVFNRVGQFAPLSLEAIGKSNRGWFVLKEYFSNLHAHCGERCIAPQQGRPDFAARARTAQRVRFKKPIRLMSHRSDILPTEALLTNDGRKFAICLHRDNQRPDSSIATGRVLLRYEQSKWLVKTVRVLVGVTGTFANPLCLAAESGHQ